MRTHSVLLGSICLLAALTLAACGGGAPEPEAPDAEGAGEESDKGSDADEAEEADNAKAKKSGFPEIPDLTPKEIIMQSDMLWMFSFSDSDLGKQQREKCEKKSKGDPAKRAACLSKVQKGVEADGIRFQKDKKDVWWFIKFGNIGTKPTNLNRIEFEVASETKDSVTLKFKGRDLGKKRMAVPPKFVIGVPSEFRIEIDDPRKGKMVYKARVGAVDDEDEKE